MHFIITKQKLNLLLLFLATPAAPIHPLSLFGAANLMIIIITFFLSP